jgi:hypothetical protein
MRFLSVLTLSAALVSALPQVAFVNNPTHLFTVPANVYSPEMATYGVLGGEDTFIVGDNHQHEGASPLGAVFFDRERVFAVETALFEESTSDVRLLAHVSRLNMTLIAVRITARIDTSDWISIASHPISLPPSTYQPPMRVTAVDPMVASWIDGLKDSKRIYQYATYLTGEDPLSNITTRQAFSPSGRVAADWIRAQFVDLGFTTSFFNYTVGRQLYNPNIIAEWPGSNMDDSDEWIVLGAHYDDRQRDMYSVTDRAPGANDDGTFQQVQWM